MKFEWIYISGYWKHVINLVLYAFLFAAAITMQCSTEWERFKMKKSQIVFSRLNSKGYIVRRTGIASAFLVLNISANLFWIFAIPKDSRTPSYYLLKVSNCSKSKSGN
jgi:hypothetical protein